MSDDPLTAKTKQPTCLKDWVCVINVILDSNVEKNIVLMGKKNDIVYSKSQLHKHSSLLWL